MGRPQGRRSICGSGCTRIWPTMPSICLVLQVSIPPAAEDPFLTMRFGMVEHETKILHSQWGMLAKFAAIEAKSQERRKLFQGGLKVIVHLP